MSPAGPLLRVAVGAAGLAGNLGGVPYIGAIAGTIEGIQKCCEKVSVHKKDSQTLSRKTMTLIEVLRANSDNAEAEELRAVADEMTLTLESIHQRVSEWAQYNFVRAFLKDGEIGNGLRKCNSEIDSLITKFQMITAFSVSNSQIKLMKFMEMHHEEMKELRTSHEEMRRRTMQLEEAMALQREGRPVAERMMEQGQLFLQKLRVKMPRLQAVPFKLYCPGTRYDNILDLTRDEITLSDMLHSDRLRFKSLPEFSPTLDFQTKVSVRMVWEGCGCYTKQNVIRRSTEYVATAKFLKNVARMFQELTEMYPHIMERLIPEHIVLLALIRVSKVSVQPVFALKTWNYY